MAHKEKETVEACSSCKYSEPSFNLLHCTIKRDSVGYNEKCSSWTKKPYTSKKKSKKDEDEDTFLEF